MKKTENIMQASPLGYARYRLMPDGADQSTDYRCEAANPVFARLVGLPAAEIIGRRISGLLPSLDEDGVFDRAARAGVTETLERYVQGTWYQVYIYSDEPGFLVTLFVDISRRKQVEKKLEGSEARLRELVDILPQIVFETDEQGKLTFVNKYGLAAFGYTEADFAAGLNTLQMIAPQDRERAANRMHQVIAGDRGDIGVEYTAVRKDGTEYPVIIYTARYLRAGKPAGLKGIIIDITERKQAEELLRESEERFKALHNASFGGIALHDKGAILECNQGLSDMTGYSQSELIGMDGLLLIAEQSRDMVMANILSGYEEPYEAVGVRKNGEEFPMRLEARNVPYKGQQVRTVEFRDITEHKRAEAEREKLQAQLNQAQKMESVGRLAGGVAHDFNNMLTVILGHAELTLARLEPVNPLFGDMQKIQKAAEHSAGVTRQLLAFARKQTVSPRVFDLTESVEEMLKMLRRLIGEQIDLVWRPGRKSGMVKMDPTQLDQVLANLCVNARDAIADVGRITIETGRVIFDEANCARQAELEPGDYVLLAVSDDGSGMGRETVANIFEPFFTTKEVGQGTGLGLATVYGIVKQNDGFINVDSEPGQGTTFRIYLPRYVDRIKEIQPESDAVKPVESGWETILLVEDEPAILEMMTKMLEQLGYVVLAAAMPGEALRLAEAHADRIDLLMTDVVMPEMNGQDLARKLLTTYPNLKRLFMSGYTADVIAHHGVLHPGVHFIQKPFSMQNLAVKIKEVLGQTS